MNNFVEVVGNFNNFIFFGEKSYSIDKINFYVSIVDKVTSFCFCDFLFVNIFYNSLSFTGEIL